MPLQAVHNITVRRLREEEQPLLEAMYASFAPLGEALGLPPPDPEQRRQWLAELKPGIVCTSLSAWGTTGPWRMRRGFDSIVQSVSGMAQDSGGADGKPRLLPVSAIDYVSGYLMAFGAAVALERRAREGGSWLVRVALARVGKWIGDLGRAPAGGSDELPPEVLTNLLTETSAPDGRITHLRPVLEMSATPPRWDRPPVPLGYHPPEWPPR